MIPGVFAEPNWNNTVAIPEKVTVIEFEEYNIVQVILDVTNNDQETLDPLYTFLVTGASPNSAQSSLTFYEKDSAYLGDIDKVGAGTCPYANIEVSPGSTEEFVLCFKIPKKSLDVYWILFSSSSPDWCEDVGPEYCEQKNYMLYQYATPEYTDYESFYQKNFIRPLETISAELTNVGLREKADLNILYASFSVTNEGDEQHRVPDDVIVVNDKGQQFEHDWAFFSDCAGSTMINPGLTKSTAFCFEIPKGQYKFDIHVRHNFPWTDECDNDNIYETDPKLCEEEIFSVDVSSAAETSTSAESTTPVASTTPDQQAGGGCGAGTVLVNGVCQLAAEDFDPTGSSLFEALAGLFLFFIFSVIAIIVIIIIIAILIKRRKTTTKPAKQDLEEYEEKYLAKEKPAKQKPAEKKEISMFCDNCGTAFKKSEARFCGECGTPRS